MILNDFLIVDDVLENPDEYVQDVLSRPFIDVPDGEKVFMGIQLVEDEELENKVTQLFINHKVVHNFIRQSPVNQSEPNYIHSDKYECDLIAILYLNKQFPKRAGTTIYENAKTGFLIDMDEYETDFIPSIKFSMKYNRMIVFPADLYHSRNIEKNFGSGDNARLVQVIFLKYK